MGVQFRNQEEYRATMNSVISNMYEGFEPTKFDIEMAQRSYVEGSPTAEEMLAQIRAAKSTTSK